MKFLPAWFRLLAFAVWLLGLGVWARADVRFDLDHLNLPPDTQRAEGYAQVPVTTPAGRAASASAPAVDPGRYVVSFRVGASPLRFSGARVECILALPGQEQQRRSLYGPDFPLDGSPQTVSFDAVLTQPTRVEVYIEWSNNQDKALTWIRVSDITVARQDKGLALTTVQANKLLYVPGEAGYVDVTVRNFTAQEMSGALTLTLTQELTRSQSLPAVPVTVPAGEEKAVQAPFTCGTREYGCEARVVLAQGDQVLDARSDFFNIADDVWKVSLGASGIGIMGMSGYCSPDSLKRDLRICRATYSNWWEKMFWPPDDWGDMNPTEAEWISGQSARWEKAQNIKDFIALCKPQGIKSITYAKNTAGGPVGWELARKHPDWYYFDDQGHIVGTYETWSLANWNNIKLHLDPQGRKQFSGDWVYLMPDLRQKPVLEWGIKQLIDSMKAYGWDGARFDGHFSAVNDDLSTWNMRQMKEEIWALNPQYVFGFNQSWSYPLYTAFWAGGMVPGWNHELAESLAGGGMYMQEAINNFAYGPGGGQRYTSWHDYATKELAAADGVRALGGAYDFILSSAAYNPVDRLYKFVLATAAGIHPTYGDHMYMVGCPNWGRFLTRWSAYVYDLNLKPRAPEGAVEVEATAPLWWKEWTKERVADASTRDVIVHLILPPADDTIDKKDNAMPAPLTNVTVTATVPAGQKLVQAFLLDPFAATEAQSLPVKLQGDRAQVTVPQVTLWSMVVFEFSGAFPLPPPRPRYTDPPDPAKAEAGRVGIGHPLGWDPANPAASAGGNKTHWVIETDGPYNSTPARAVDDPDAGNGLAQIRDSGVKSIYVGRPWVAGLSAGKYVAHLRIKLEDHATPTRRQHLSMRVLLEGVSDHTVEFGTPEYKYPPERTFIVDNKYHFYDLSFECPNDGTWPILIGSASTPDDGDQRFFMDRMEIDQVEAYTDAVREKTVQMAAPAGLTPEGAGGLSILCANGWTWDTYGLDTVLPAVAGADHVTSLWSSGGEVEKFPQKYEDLYKYNVVVLCDVGAAGLQYAGRRVLRDFVKAGGGLVVLGGLYTLGQGAMNQTYFDELLPIQITAGRDVQRAAPPLPLRPGSLTQLLAGIPPAFWKQDPVLYWRHLTRPRAGAGVALYAGPEPVLITGTLGQGRVAVFTGTALGDRQGTELPFWEWPGWKILLANTVRWAATGKT